MKSGIFTTEFWLSLLGVIVGPGGLIFFLQDKIDPTSLAGVAIMALGAAAAVIYNYIKGRNQLKMK